MTKTQILTEQAKNYDDDALLDALTSATDTDEIRVLELEMEVRTSPYFRPDSQRSLLADLLAGGGPFC